MADRLELEARFNDHASAGVKKLGKTLGEVKPSNGMAQATKWMQGFRKEADSAIKASRDMPSVLSGIGIGGLAASMSLGALAKSLKSAADGALDLRELGRESGMAAVEIQRLQFAAGKLHVDPSAVTNAIKSWSSQMLDFRTTRSRFYRYLNTYNNADIAKKIAADSPEQGFKDTLDYLSRIPAAAMKAGKSQADAMEIQRRVANMAGVGDLVPALAKGPEGLKEAYAEAALKVKPISQEMIDAAERMNASTNSFNQSWTNMLNSVGPSLIDPLTGAIDKMEGVFREGEKLFSHGPEAAPPPKPDGSPGESTGEFLTRTLRNTLRTEFGGDSGIAKDGKWLWDNLFGASDAHADELRPGMRAMPPTASAKWSAPSRYDAEVRARGRGLTYDAPNHDGNALRRTDEMPVSSLPAAELFATVRQGSREGIIQGLRELAQQQELEGGGGGSFGGAAPGRGGSAGMPNLRYGRPKAGGQYRHGPGADGGDPGGAFNPRQPEKAGTYRPEYKLSDADLSDYVVNTVNGEATSSAESIDAVINNMLNRVGSKGWGPCACLRHVASAPGQYAGHRPASAQVAERIRARIRAIASGGVPDNTNGSNAYRAAWYHGKWYQQHVGDGRVVGGNRFAYEPWTKNGPYAPYPARAMAPSPTGTPSAAVTDAEVFAARQRLMAGGHDPKDIALRDRYLKEQNTPQKHRAGGWIRGPGGPTADRVPAMLSNGEFVVNARASGEWAHLLHAINDGTMARFANGGPVGFGVAKAFYPTSSPGISDGEGAGNRRFWRDFFRKPLKEGGMGAPWRTTLAALAMMQGESGRGLNSKLYNWDVNGPSGGVDQLHDVTTGRGAGRLHRLSDLMRLATMQHADWHDPIIQAANFKREALGSMNFAWSKMLAAKTARGALKEGIDKFENPANHALELLRRMPNLVRLQREAVADGAAQRQAMDPLDVTIKHHPHTGHPIVTARAGRGVNLKIRTAPTMRPT